MGIRRDGRAKGMLTSPRGGLMRYIIIMHFSVLSTQCCLCCLQHKRCPINSVLSLLSTTQTVSYQLSVVSVVNNTNGVLSTQCCLCCQQHKRCPINSVLSLLSTTQTVSYQPSVVSDVYNTNGVLSTHYCISQHAAF
jgi:hypothetical protein